MTAQTRPIFESFQRLADMCDQAAESPRDFAEAVRVWRTRALFVMELPRAAALHPMAQSWARTRHVLPQLLNAYPRAKPEYFRLLTELLEEAEKDCRVIYVPDCTSWTDLDDFLRHNNHWIEPPQDIEITGGLKLIATEWNHHSVVLALNRSGQFSGI